MGASEETGRQLLDGFNSLEAFTLHVALSRRAFCWRFTLSCRDFAIPNVGYELGEDATFEVVGPLFVVADTCPGIVGVVSHVLSNLHDGAFLAAEQTPPRDSVATPLFRTPRGVVFFFGGHDTS